MESEANMNSKGVGEISEAVVVAELMKAGKTVLVPMGDNQRYDLVIEEAGKFIRVQVKTARKYRGCLVFNTCSLNPFSSVRRDYSDDVDLFMVYSPDTQRVYLIPVNQATKTQMSLRLDPAGKFSPFTKWAKDFEFTVASIPSDL